MANDVKVKIDFSPTAVTKRYKNKGNLALTTLKNEIIKDTDSYVPMRDGGLKKSAISSTGTKKMQIVYRKVYARFLYYGKVMVGMVSRKAWANKGETKETINKDLTYSQGRSHWFEESKKKNLNKWIDIAKKLFKK